MPKLLSYGGIGDTLRNIARVPHRFLHRSLGIRYTVIHKHWKKIGSFDYTHPPAPEVIEGLVARCPSLHWGGEVDSARCLGTIEDKALRETIRFFNGGVVRYFPFEFALTPEENAALPALPAGSTIGLQTHLSGMKTKSWGIDNWRKFIARLAEAYPGLSILLLDTAPEVAELAVFPRIATTLACNLPQSMRLIRDLRLLISIDSWSKYVAAWNKVPQIVIAPDVRAEYPSVHPDQMLRTEFGGIYGNPANTVIGLEKDARGKGAYTLARMSDLSPEELFARASERLGAPVVKID